MIRLAVALPAYGSKLDVGHAAMWLGLGAALTTAQDKIFLASFTPYHINGIALCRNTIVYDAMTAGCDWVLMIDADTFHETGTGTTADAIGDAGVDIIQMIRDAARGQYNLIDVASGSVCVDIDPFIKRNGIALVGAPVHGREVNGDGVCVQKLELNAPPPREALTIDWEGQRTAEGAAKGYRSNGSAHYRAGRRMGLSSLAGTMQCVGRIGAACIAVNLGWLREHWPVGPWFDFAIDYTGRPRVETGEDYAICDGIWQRGGAVVCDGRFVPKHVDRRRLAGEP